MSVPEIYGQMFDASVRFEAAWPFPVSEPPGGLAEAFEYNDDGMPGEIAALYEKWSDEEKDELFGGDGYEFNEAYGELCGKAFR